MSTLQEKEYIAKMAEWGKRCARWQLEHPEKDLVTELAAAHTATGGDNPPSPPPHP